MTPQKSSAKDVFLNLGAIVALSIFIGNLVSLIYTIIDKAYPAISPYSYYSTYSISFPVATLIIFFPIYVLLMWLLEKDYSVNPQNRNSGIRKWLTYITLFISGLFLAGDLVWVLYYFIDGQELTTGFIMKAAAVLVISLGVFFYYISDAMGKLNSASRKIWAAMAVVVILGSIAWGFSVLGSPHTQQLYRYDEQKVSDLQTVNQEVISYFQSKSYLPGTLSELSALNYSAIPTDVQLQKPYEYILVGQSAKAYQLCADFNRSSDEEGAAVQTYPYDTANTWSHPAGHYCFSEAIDISLYPKVPNL